MEKIICPLCGYGPADWFCEKNGHNLYRCRKCRSGFVWPLPGDTAGIYSPGYFKGASGGDNRFGYSDYEEDKKAMAGVFKKYLDEISLVAAGKKLMDLGAATGFFLDLARARGYRTAGLEISAYAANLARDKGHEIILGGLAELKKLAEENKERFDAVTAWDVLEHLADPAGYIKASGRILKPGGIFAVNTIDNASLWARLWGPNWQAIAPPEHLFYYSPASLKTLLENNGFKIIQRKKIGKKFTLPYIFKVLANRYHLKVLNKFSDFFNRPGWRKIYLPINLRDNIFIIARKA